MIYDIELAQFRANSQPTAGNLMLLALALRFAGKEQAAVEAASKAAYMERSAEAYCFLAEHFISEGEYAKAERHLERAIALGDEVASKMLSKLRGDFVLVA